MTDLVLGLGLFGGALFGLGALLGSYAMWRYAAGLGWEERDGAYSIDEDTKV